MVGRTNKSLWSLKYIIWQIYMKDLFQGQIMSLRSKIRIKPHFCKLCSFYNLQLEQWWFSNHEFNLDVLFQSMFYWTKKTGPSKGNSWGVFPSQKPEGISKCGNNIFCTSWKNKHFLFYAQEFIFSRCTNDITTTLWYSF